MRAAGDVNCDVSPLSESTARGAVGHPKLGGLAGAWAGTAIATENLSVKNFPMTELSARE
jgi:hypothetical protein